MKITIEFDKSTRSLYLSPEDEMETFFLRDILERSEKGTSMKLVKMEDSPYKLVMDINGQKRNYDALEEK